MLYFAGGANNDQDGWNYIGRFERIFEDEGIAFRRIDFSGGKMDDVHFTVAASREAWFRPLVPSTTIPDNYELARYQTRSSHNDMIAFRAARHVHEVHDAAAGANGALNLMGYSYGSVLMAHVALILSDNRDRVGTLVLVGSPIPSSSPLFAALGANPRINRVLRHDIPGDLLSNPGIPLQDLVGAIQNMPDSGPHFDLARPDDPDTPNRDEGAEADARIRRLARFLHGRDVR